MNAGEDAIRIRDATREDAAAIARLHTQVWRRTYRDLAPAAAFAALDEACRRETWNDLLAHPRPQQVALVAERDARLAGFGLAGAPGDPAFGGRGEVKYLYVDAALHRRGIGRRLLAESARRLDAKGFAGLALGVVTGNAPAMAFYAALGGRAVGVYDDPGPIWRSRNIVYAWDDLAALAAGR